MANEPKDIKTIFSEALERKSAEERTAYLNQVCGHDAALRAKVEVLLKAYVKAGDFLEAPVFDPAVTLDGGPVVEGPGAVIGPYKLLEKIGEGGMAVVYMAEQEKPLRRRVALKIIKLGMDTQQVVARFEAERQVLAMMDHPSIAKVFDAGTTDTGRPYFVMELVRGGSITEYCDRHLLDTRERLDLFLQVCGAVQHAHQKGIIHRDIKPSNVMVTLHEGKALPVVIDFGIAKATSQRLTEKTLFTRYAQMIGTPEYMSPEQAEMSRLDVDTRTDIYSLGVLLYELLTGTLPFDAERLLTAGYVEIQRIIREEEPDRPSTRLSTMGEALTEVAKHRRASADSLTRLIRGDLDWIVMKSLEKDPARRYGTAVELATDIERHLNHEAVLAGTPKASYKLRKFMRRHRVGVTAGFLVVMALVVGLAVSTAMYFEAEEARMDALEQQQIAEDALEKEEEARSEAIRAQQIAEEQRQIAESERDKAREAEQHAEERRSEAVAQREEAERQRERAQEQQQIAEIALEKEAIARAEAVGAQRIAQEQREVAESERDKAQEAERLEALARIQAERAQRAEQEQRTLAEQRAEEYRRSLYVNRIRLADKYYSESNIGRVRDLLSACPEDLRGWEWYHLWHKSDQSRLTLRGHQGNVLSVAFSPNGKWLVSGGGDSLLKVWDVESASEVKTLHGHEDAVRSVAFSPDGKQIASGGADGTIRIWDVESGSEAEMLQGDDDVVLALAFSPDGQRIVSGGEDKLLKVWDIESGSELLTLSGHELEVLSVAFSPDGSRIVSGSEDNTLKIWDAETGENLMTLKGHASRVLSVAFHPHGRKFLSGSGDSNIKVWDLSGGSELMTLSGHDWNVSSVALSPDGRRIVSGSWSGAIKVWDAESGREETTLRGHEGKVASVVFSPDGRWIVSGGGDGTLRFWDPEKAMTNIKLTGHGCPVEAVALSPNGRQIASSGAWDRVVKLWDADSGRELRTFHGNTDGGRLLTFSPDGRHIVAGSNNSTVKMWDTESGREEMIYRGREDQGSSLAYSSDYTRVVSSSPDNELKVWTTEGGSDEIALKGPKRQISSMIFSPDGERIVAGSWDGWFGMWDARAGDVAAILQTGGWSATAIVYSPDGTQIVSGHYNGSLVVWDAQNGDRVTTCRGHGDTVFALVFSPDGRRIVSGSADRTLRVWDSTSGGEVITLPGHESTIRSIAFSRDGKRIVSGSEDGMLKVWDAADPKEVAAERLAREEGVSWTRQRNVGPQSVGEEWMRREEQRLLSDKNAPGVELDAQATATGLVDTNAVYQELEGFGAAGAYYEGWLTAHPLKNEIYNILFGQLGIDIYRIRNIYDVQAESNQRMAWSSEIIQAARLSLGHPVKIMISSWSPPAHLKSNASTKRGTLARDPAGEYRYYEFAKWWADSLREYSRHGIRADYISIQNQPDILAQWDSCRFAPSEAADWAGYDLALEAVYQELQQSMVAPPKLLAGGAFGLKSTGPYIDALIDPDHSYGYAHHLYGDGDYHDPDSFVPAMERFRSRYGDRPVFLTEYSRERDGAGYDVALNLAHHIHNSLVHEGVCSYVQWDLFWGERDGLVTLDNPWEPDPGYTINPTYYALKHFSAFTDPRWRRVEASTDSNDLRISAFISPEATRLTVVVINVSEIDVALTLSVREYPIERSTVFQTSQTEYGTYIGTFDPSRLLILGSQTITTVTMTMAADEGDGALAQFD